MRSRKRSPRPAPGHERSRRSLIQQAFDVMTRRKISTGTPFEKAAGYSRAIVDGDWCFVAGTTGYDYATMQMPDDVREQTRNCLETIRDTLGAAGFAMEDVVRASYILTDRCDVERVFDVLGETFGEIRPAATMIIAELVRPEMKIEIEVTARKRSGASPKGQRRGKS